MVKLLAKQELRAMHATLRYTQGCPTIKQIYSDERVALSLSKGKQFSHLAI